MWLASLCGDTYWQVLARQQTAPAALLGTCEHRIRTLGLVLPAVTRTR